MLMRMLKLLVLMLMRMLKLLVLMLRLWLWLLLLSGQKLMVWRGGNIKKAGALRLSLASPQLNTGPRRWAAAVASGAAGGGPCDVRRGSKE